MPPAESTIEPVTAVPPAAAAQQLAQGIVCGQWALAFSFDWARQIVERFELSAIPKAPSWLLGAANVDGNIVPVVDLARYFDAELTDSPRAAQQRLLVGGLQGTNADDAIAFAFVGLPIQLKYRSTVLTYPSALPAKLREVCDGVAKDGRNRDFLEINIQRLKALLTDELLLL